MGRPVPQPGQDRRSHPLTHPKVTTPNIIHGALTGRATNPNSPHREANSLVNQALTPTISGQVARTFWVHDPRTAVLVRPPFEVR
jgi:hypothetical protein